MLETIQSFINQSRYKELNTVKGSKGLCDSVSVDLKKYLYSIGVECEVIEGIGYKPLLDDSAHADWQVFKGKDQKFLAHVVVKVNETVIDLTGAQFNSKNANRMVYPYEIFKQEWKQIKKPKTLNKN